MTVFFISMLVIIISAVVLFFTYNHSEKSNKHIGYAMGSEITVIFYGNDKKEIADDIFSEISNLDLNGISRKAEASEIFMLNQNGSFELSEEILSYINKALEICKSSNGALDITLGNISSLWDFDSAKKIIPEKEKIENLLSFTGYEKIKTNGNTVTLGKNQVLDMGALGKGIACDIAKSVLDKNDINQALIAVGGTVLTYSDNKKTWSIGIRTPDENDTSAFLKLELTGINFISTSGNYEKFFESNGKLYHHILNPETGFPVENELKSVTVISDNGLISDALSTACFVLGRENSEELLKKYKASVIFVDKENNVYISDEIAKYCTILNDSYRIGTYE